MRKTDNKFYSKWNILEKSQLENTTIQKKSKNDFLFNECHKKDKINNYLINKKNIKLNSI